MYNSRAVTVEKRRHLRSGERCEDGMLVALRGLAQRDRSTQAKACHSYELSMQTSSKTETRLVTDAIYNAYPTDNKKGTDKISPSSKKIITASSDKSPQHLSG